MKLWCFASKNTFLSKMMKRITTLLKNHCIAFQGIVGFTCWLFCEKETNWLPTSQRKRNNKIEWITLPNQNNSLKYSSFHSTTPTRTWAWTWWTRTWWTWTFFHLWPSTLSTWHFFSINENRLCFFLFCLDDMLFLWLITVSTLSESST